MITFKLVIFNYLK